MCKSKIEHIALLRRFRAIGLDSESVRRMILNQDSQTKLSVQVRLESDQTLTIQVLICPGFYLKFDYIPTKISNFEDLDVVG